MTGPVHPVFGLGMLTRSSGQRAIIDALRVAGAISPDAAVPRTSLGPISDESLGVLVRDGIVREGAPGTFYLHEFAAPRRVRVLRLLLFLLIVILVPVVVIWLASG